MRDAGAVPLDDPTATPLDDASPDGDLAEVVRRELRLLAASDPASVRALLHDDARAAGVTGVVATVPGQVGGAVEDPSGGAGSVRPVRLADDVVLLTYTRAGTARTSVWVRDPARGWLLRHHHMTALSPAPPAEPTPPSRVAAADLRPGHPTAGMQRFEAVVLPDVWSGLAVTEPGSTSGWHHHGEHDTVAYVVRGAFRVETAAGVVQGDAGDFVHVPAHTVHRETNPTDERAEVVLVRRGTGAVVVEAEPPGAAQM